MHFDPGVETIFADCHSQIPGQNSPEMYLNSGVSLSLRRYSGGLAIYDTGQDSVATLEFLVGNCRLLTGNTGGQIVVRGLATLTDQTQGTVVITEGLIVPNTLPTKVDLDVVNRNVKKASLLIPATDNIF